MKKIEKIHGPKNFDPRDYTIIDYFDKHLPTLPSRAYPETRAAFEAMRAAWESRRQELFGERRHLVCDHCGQSNVMWVVAVDCISTKERLCFGWICAERIGLSLDAYKKKMLQQYRKSQASKLFFAQKRSEFREKNADIIPWLEVVETASGFIQSLQEKFLRQGELSERQMEALRAAKSREESYQQKKAEREQALSAAPPAPEGLQTIQGVVLSTKVKETQFGTEFKMIVEMDNKNRVWVTIPQSISHQAQEKGTSVVGCRVELTATFTRSNTDNHFAFGKRPTRAHIITISNT